MIQSYPEQVHCIIFCLKNKYFGGSNMKLHKLNDGNYSVKIRGIDGEFITSSWSTAMEIAWKLGCVR